MKKQRIVSKSGAEGSQGKKPLVAYTANSVKCGSQIRRLGVVQTTRSAEYVAFPCSTHLNDWMGNLAGKQTVALGKLCILYCHC